MQWPAEAPSSHESAASNESGAKANDREAEVVRWTIELENALLRAIVDEWHAINENYFRGLLLSPVFRLGDASTRLGQWIREHRVLEISRRLVVDAPWGDVVEVLKHEAAHQYVHEALRKDEPPHGPTFRSLCEKMNIDARATGSIQAGAPGEPTAEVAMIRRVQKLLALAQSPNQHEAENAASAAQRLMLKYNLDERTRESSDAKRQYGYRHLGEPTGRVFEHRYWVATILREHFFVETIWISVFRPREGKSGTVLEICGTPANLAMAEYVHEFLLGAAERLWFAHKREQGVRSNRDRLRFMAGVMAGFSKKLDGQRTKHEKEGLVWVPHAQLRQYYRTRHPRVTSVRSGGNARNDAYESGREAGRNLVLSRPVEGSTSRADGPRRLGPAGRR